jgi:hypothetical protein
MIKGRQKTRFATAGCATGRRSIATRVRRQVNAHDALESPGMLEVIERKENV